MLSSRQVMGALAALAAALAVFYPSDPRFHRMGSPEASSEADVSRTRCPLGYGAPDDEGANPHGSKAPPIARVFTGARIYTGDATVPWAEAMAVTDAGRVLAVGTLRDVTLAAGANAPTTSLARSSATGDVDAASETADAYVFPGLFDAHAHLVSGGFRLAQLDLSRVSSKDEFLRAVSAAAKARASPDDWILGGGWDETRWGGALPDASWFAEEAYGIDADAAVWLLRADAHAGVASAGAMRRAGAADLTDPSLDPPGGVVERDGSGGTNRPTGLFRDNAMPLVTRAVPPPSETARREAFGRAFREMLSLGITSACDFGDVYALAGSATKGATERVWRDLDILRDMDAKEELPVRVSAYVPLADWERARDDPNAGWFREKASEDDRAGGTYGDSSRLRVAGCKAFLDGSLGARTALFHEPYADAGSGPDDGTSRGMATCDLAEFEARAVAAAAAGLQVAVHAIGDAAVSAAIQAAEAQADSSGAGARDVRFRVEHAQHLPSPLESFPRRARRVGAVVSAQPAQMALDRASVVERVGADRASRAYAFRATLDAGVELAFGSDWPIVTADPLEGMRAAVARTKPPEDDAGTEDNSAWEPSQRLEPREALAAYTTGAARAAHLEGSVGTLWRGGFADFVVFDADPLVWLEDAKEASDEGRKQRARKPNVTSTWVGGRLAFTSADATANP